MNTSKTLWSNASRSRHFIIPDNEKILSGEFVVRTILGREQWVDSSSLAQFEVPEDQATDWLKEQLGQVVKSVKDVMLDSIREKMYEEPDLDAWFGPGTEDNSSYKPPEREQPEQQPAKQAYQCDVDKITEDSPLELLFSLLTNETPENIRSDPDSVKRGVRSIIDELDKFIPDVGAFDKAAEKTDEQTIKLIQDIIQQLGVNVEDITDRLPDHFRETIQFSNTHDSDADNADRLDALADEILRGVDWLRKQAIEIRYSTNKTSKAEQANKHETQVE